MVLSLLVGFLLFASPIMADNRRWTTSLPEALAEAKQLNRPIMVHVYADWCPSCKMMKREVYPAPMVSRELDHYVTASINGEKSPSLMDRFQIRGFPTLLFMDKNGALLDRVEGGMDAASLARLLRQDLQKAERESVVLSDLRRDPNSVMANFNAGVYYSELGDHTKARGYFVRSWRSPAADPSGKKLDSLYNAAVSSMELKDYPAAITYWSNYISAHPRQDLDYANARLYRGLSLKYTGEKKRAAEDLRYAVQKHPDGRIRNAAQDILKELGER